jgi:ribosomal protein L11 methylase PrmA
MSDPKRVQASFRDPSGFLFQQEGALYRQVNSVYQEDYELLFDSGLYKQLSKRGLMVAHSEADISPPAPELVYKIIQPSRLDFISYPYEWSFSQLKDAALLTLSIQKLALKHGMSLKDSSAYNIQFRMEDGCPVLIDTLSFEKYQEGSPWVAYRQYCQHFLAPLALMAFTDIRLSQLLRVYIDGIPLDLASQLLPRKTRRNFGLLTHLHMHASAQKRYAGESQEHQQKAMSKTNLLALIDNLERTTKKLDWAPGGTEWGDYYEDTNYTPDAINQKKELVAKLVEQVKPGSVWDMGANTGFFSRTASQQGIPTISFDIDPTAVEKNYLEVKEQKESNLLPLVLDLTNPSPDIGWANQERSSLPNRSTPDMILALALIHHLAISNNLPLEMIAEYFSGLAPWLVIEFVPKEDSQVQRLLATREDIFEHYHFPGFEQAFQQYFQVMHEAEIPGTLRKLYLMQRKS